jgi:hypothetical protein
VVDIPKHHLRPPTTHNHHHHHTPHTRHNTVSRATHTHPLPVSHVRPCKSCLHVRIVDLLDTIRLWLWRVCVCVCVCSSRAFNSCACPCVRTHSTPLPFTPTRIALVTRPPQVLTKYKLAGEMSNRVLKAVRSECVAGKRTIDICKLGDELILKETGSVYNKQKEPIKKGGSILFSRPLPPCAVCYAACACACEL